MGFEDLRERIERLLGGDRQHAGAYRDALIDLKVGIQDLADAIAATGRELESERNELGTAERRGKLAQDIGDRETVDIAAAFVEKHRARVAVLERKLAVQRDELELAQHEYDELGARFRSAKQGIPANGAATGPAPTVEDSLLKARMDRQAAEAAVEAQLEMLKKKLGRQ